MSRILGVSLAALAIFADHVAAAQSVDSTATVQHLPTYCNVSTLDGDEFMRMISTIIVHGDLTDVEFMEKTLGTKLTVSYGWKRDGTPDHQKPVYHTDHVLGSPIQATLFVNTVKANPPKSGWISSLDFGIPSFPLTNSNFMIDCLHISTSEFFAVYKGPYDFTVPVPSPAAPPLLGSPKVAPTGSVNATAAQLRGAPGKNGSELDVRFSYAVYDMQNFTPGNSRVSRVIIVQNP